MGGYSFCKSATFPTKDFWQIPEFLCVLLKSWFIYSTQHTQGSLLPPHPDMYKRA